MRSLCKKLVLALTFSLFFGLTTPVHAQQMGEPAYYFWQASLTSPVGSKVLWAQDTVKVEDKGVYQEALLEGSLPEKSTALKLNGRPIPLRPDAGFKILLGFQGTEKTFSLEYINAESAPVTETFTLSLNRSQGTGTRKLVKNSGGAKSSYSVGVGIVFLHFEQTDIVPFDEKAISLKGSYNLRFPNKHWDFGVSSFYNVAVLGSDTLEHPVKFLGVNAKVGYNFNPENRSVQFSLAAGLYYNTSFGDIGFTNVAGPQLYPVLTVFQGEKNAFRFYGKFSPVSNVGGQLHLSTDHEVALGVSYSTYFGKQLVFFAFDYAKLDLTQDPTSVSVSTNSLSVGLGF